ncbi:hypothetical protein JTB14_005999 [Gonioctena quinquepunctata]|nr:hypothetical protein JTB14_005999 [Gonioctena quinquepunctata]
MKLDCVTRRDWKEYELKGELSTLEEMKSFLKHKCNHKNKQRVQVHSNTQGNNMKCFFCKNNHAIYSCESFLKLSVENRIQEAKKKHLCLNCLRPGHTNQFCRLSGCRKCNRKHNTLMHLEQVSGSHQARVGDAEPLINKEDNASVVQTTTCNLSMSTRQVILSTATVLVEDKNDQFHEARDF